jgi:diguanylate cyclase (GGDEF)-like protein
LLQQVTERLVTSIRERDIVARQGGDEFIYLLEDIDKSLVREISERIHKSFTKSFTISNQEFIISPSIGISIFPHDEMITVP